jgi:DNA repair exonuclease SbcCD ATPase subunit
MILCSIMTKRLRGLKQTRPIDFTPGLNVIKGSDNEAGKSSLRIAITKALFQDPTTTRDDVHALTSWGTDDPWEISLDFQSDNESYRVTKRLRDGWCELVRIGSSESTITSKNAVADKMAEMVGCPSEVFFESTACIRQDELIRIIPHATATEQSKALGTITQRLQATISGTEAVDVRSILLKLYNKMHQKAAKGPYWHLLEIGERINNLQRENLAQQDKVNKITENRKELNRIREEIEKIGKNLPAKQEIASKNTRILELQKEIERDKTQHSNYQRAKTLKSELDSLDEKLKRFSYFTGAEKKIEHVNTVHGELQSLKKQQIGLEEDTKTVRQQRPALWLLIAGVGFLVGGLIGLLASKYLGIVAAIGLVFSLYWLISITTWKKQLGSISKRKVQLENDIRHNNSDIKDSLSAFGCSDYAEYEEHLMDYKEITNKGKEVSDKLKGLVGDKDWATFERENQNLDIQVNADQKELKQLLPFKLAPIELQEVVNEVKEKGGHLESLEAKRRGLDEFFQYIDVDTDQLASTSEEITRLQQEKKFWERKQAVFEATHQVLEEAHRQTLSKAANVLEGDLSRYMNIVTDGRYTQVKINENDLSIRAFSPEKGAQVDVLELSRATQDQFYICARFALVKLITEGKRPPLLMDDPFVNFHPKRLNKMMQLLQELAKENQILLFTCSDAYDAYGNVIILE